MVLKTLVGSMLLCAVGLPALAGGGGPVTIQGRSGKVQIREIDYHTGRPTGAWKRATVGELEGSYLLRTERGSWAHLDLPFSIREQGKWRPVGAACLDSQSLLRIDSYADSGVRVVRGQVSRADGRRGKSLPRAMGSF